ncbi:MAG: hypothetical protein O3A20_01745 [Planctomycetota bacterium]|nr:hypothetical protein [Planctomycetota bacterium]
MEYRSKIALGCGGFLVLAVIAAVAGWWSMVHGFAMTSEPEEVRARSLAIVALEPKDPLTPFFARRMERGGGDEAVIWAVDSRYQNLMVVIRTAASEPESAEAMVEALARVHPNLSGFEAEPGAKRVPVTVLGVERVALSQSARTMEETKQGRVCVSFPYDGRWVLLLLQGDPVDATSFALQKLLDGVQAPAL